MFFAFLLVFFSLCLFFVSFNVLFINSSKPFAPGVRTLQVLVHIDGCLMSEKLRVQLTPDQWASLQKLAGP